MHPSSSHAPTLEKVWQKINPRNELIDERRDLLALSKKAGVSGVCRQQMDISRISVHAPLSAWKIAEGIEMGILEETGLSISVQKFLTGKITLKETLGTLIRKVGGSSEGLRKRLTMVARFGMVEFHATDVCNCACPGCVFGQAEEAFNLKRKVFPFHSLDRIKALAPKAMILVGGGEPTIYRDGPFRFGDLVNRLKHLLPGIRFGLVTNGTIFPKNTDWNSFDFVRISLGALDAESYRLEKGVDGFSKVLDNAKVYLKSPVPLVSFNYMLNRHSFDKCFDFVKFIFDLAGKISNDVLRKCSIQFRALVFPPSIHRLIKKNLSTEELAVTTEQIQDLKRRLHDASLTPSFLAFILKQTNLEDCLQGTRSHNPQPFLYCPHALVFGQIRANGTVQPCNVRSDDPIVALGNALKPDGFETMALKQFQVFLKSIGDNLCDATHCRRHGMNRYLLNHSSFFSPVHRIPNFAVSHFELRENYNNYLSTPSGIRYFF